MKPFFGSVAIKCALDGKFITAKTCGCKTACYRTYKAEEQQLKKGKTITYISYRIDLCITSGKHMSKRCVLKTPERAGVQSRLSLLADPQTILKSN